MRHWRAPLGSWRESVTSASSTPSPFRSPTAPTSLPNRPGCAPGGGKTSLLKLFTPSVLQHLVAMKGNDAVKELFAKLKAFLRAARPRSFDQVVELMRVAITLFTPAECANFIRYCGYPVAT